MSKTNVSSNKVFLTKVNLFSPKELKAGITFIQNTYRKPTVIKPVSIVLPPPPSLLPENENCIDHSGKKQVTEPEIEDTRASQTSLHDRFCMDLKKHLVSSFA